MTRFNPKPYGTVLDSRSAMAAFVYCRAAAKCFRDHRANFLIGVALASPNLDDPEGSSTQEPRPFALWIEAIVHPQVAH
jgi:hypothetical protein